MGKLFLTKEINMKFFIALAPVAFANYSLIYNCINNISSSRSPAEVCNSNGEKFQSEWEFDFWKCQNLNSSNQRVECSMSHQDSNGHCKRCNNTKTRWVCGSDLRAYRNECEIQLFNCLDKVGCKIKRKTFGRCKKIKKKAKKIYYC